MSNYAQYQDEVRADVAATLTMKQCQPILFVGSGFSLRYGKGPTWETLLSDLAASCPLIDKDFAYYKQKHKSDLTTVGSVFADRFFEWAWSKEGRQQFPPELFTSSVPPNIYLKHAAAQRLAKLSTNGLSKDLQAELSALRELGPHAIITTNYDSLLEPIFPDYEVIIGQNLFRKSALVVGEIFKIHGAASDPGSMILTKEDYEGFYRDKKYLSAKLLTYFAEHPLVFIGYSASDPNIKSVLYDISRMSTPTASVVPNIYILQWDKSLDPDSYPAHEHVLEVGDDITVRVKSITANSYEWVYRAFGVGGTLEHVDLKALRSLAHRMQNLIRTDIPTKNAQVNYESLEHAISNEEIFANLFGITNLGDPTAANAAYPYTAKMLTEKLGLPHFNATNKLIARIKNEKGFDIKSTDNIYHVQIKTGQAAGSRTRKYSDAAVGLLKKVRDNGEYEIPAQLLGTEGK